MLAFPKSGQIHFSLCSFFLLSQGTIEGKDIQHFCNRSMKRMCDCRKECEAHYSKSMLLQDHCMETLKGDWFLSQV